MAAMFSMEITGRMYASLPPCRNRRMVRGTKMMRDTSLVTNMEEKNTPNTRNRDRGAIRSIFALRDTKGRSRFSCLKPSSTVSIMKRVPRVRQSTARSREASGGVMKRETAAASRDTVSISSFFRKRRIGFIYPPGIVFE